MIDVYIQFSRNDVAKLDVMRKEGGKEGRMKLAILLRRMKTTAKEVDIPIGEQVSVLRLSNLSNLLKVKENVDKYCEKFEKDMLRLFDRSYRKGDPTMMAVCCAFFWVQLLTSVTSTVQKCYWSSMEGTPAYEYTSINTPSLLESLAK